MHVGWWVGGETLEQMAWEPQGAVILKWPLGTDLLPPRGSSVTSLGLSSATFHVCTVTPVSLSRLLNSPKPASMQAPVQATG